MDTKATFPGPPRSAAVAFSVNERGYFGTGFDGKEYYKDFWEYDPETNKWTQKTDFPGSARNDATAFGLSDKGYIGSGYDGNYLKDFYVYDPQIVNGNRLSVWEVANAGEPLAL